MPQNKIKTELKRKRRPPGRGVSSWVMGEGRGLRGWSMAHSPSTAKVWGRQGIEKARVHRRIKVGTGPDEATQASAQRIREVPEEEAAGGWTPHFHTSALQPAFHMKNITSSPFWGYTKLEGARGRERTESVLLMGANPNALPL